MNEKKYCDLVTVDTGDGLRVGHIDRDVSFVVVGDLVSLDTGESGIAAAVIFAEEGSEDYSFIANLVPIYEVTGVYRCAWKQEESNAHP